MAKMTGSMRSSTSGSKAYGLIDEDYEEDIGLSEDDGVNEELGIDVDDDEDDEDDYGWRWKDYMRHESAGTSRSGYMKLLPGGCAYVIAGTDALIDMNLTENKKKEGNFNSYDLECLA
ncbi:hypothetical protein Tco_1181315 [Tanacetum coccineum]